MFDFLDILRSNKVRLERDKKLLEADDIIRQQQARIHRLEVAIGRLLGSIDAGCDISSTDVEYQLAERLITRMGKPWNPTEGKPDERA